MRKKLFERGKIANYTEKTVATLYLVKFSEKICALVKAAHRKTALMLD